MPHGLNLGRRVSRLAPAPRLSTLVLCLAVLTSVACNSDDPAAPGSGDEVPNAPTQTGSKDSPVVVNDSLVDGIDFALATASTGTTIYPGQDIQAKVNSYPNGTTFTLKPGIYRMQQISPKASMTFIGEAGAILNGSRLLTTFTKQGSYWVASGQTQQGARTGDGYCMSDSPRCAYPEQLFINNKMLKHVASLAAVTPGTWFFDYPNDKIYFADDPSGRIVETSVTSYAFYSSASGVTIRGLVVEKYASPAQVGAIGGQGGTPHWVIQDNEVRWNHGSGIRTGAGMQVIDNSVHHQGQIGIGGSGDDMLVQGNEIAYNNVAGFGTHWEAGATKFSRTDGLIVRGNFSHHNHGAGLWTDIDNINTLYENNRVEDNDWRGIYHEISYKVVIRNNIIQRNGFNLPLERAFPVDGAGILIHDSQNAEIYGNTIANNFNGIGGIESDRGSGAYGVHNLINLNVHDNVVTQPTGRAAGAVQVVGSNAVFTKQNNRFTHNTYDLAGNPRYFRWMNGDCTTPEWKGYGLDVTGTFR